MILKFFSIKDNINIVNITTMSEIINPPIYDGKETINQYLDRIKEYEISLKRNKYNIILNFINQWVSPYKLKFKSLLEFKNIEMNSVLLDTKHNKKILKRNCLKICEKLYINSNIDEEIDTDDIPENEIIIFLRKILETIEYSLIKRKIDNKYYYTILSTLQYKKKSDEF